VRVRFLVIGMLWGGRVFAAAPSLDFNREVRPILSNRCFACHGPDRASRKSPLRLDQEESARPALAGGKLPKRLADST
jgi:mono/diheme cytochrome c family protein